MLMYMFQLKTCCLDLVYKNIVFKNHWTKDKLVYTHVDAISTLIPNMGTIFNNSENFDKIL